MIPPDVKNDPVYRQLYEKTQMVARNNLHDITRQPQRQLFTETNFTAIVVAMRTNAVGGLLVTFETQGAEKDKAWPLSDVQTAGEEVQIHATRKV